MPSDKAMQVARDTIDAFDNERRGCIGKSGATVCRRRVGASSCQDFCLEGVSRVAAALDAFAAEAVAAEREALKYDDGPLMETAAIEISAKPLSGNLDAIGVIEVYEAMLAAAIRARKP